MGGARRTIAAEAGGTRVKSLMRTHLLGIALLASASACASPGLPPGGPPDDLEPQIVRITPDTNAVNVRVPAVLFHFDEVISERPAAQTGQASSGEAGLQGIVRVSPTDGRDEVIWRRTAIEVRPRRGFRPNTTYRVTLLPGVVDLRGNAKSAGTELVFSTGASLPSGEVSGVFFDWAAGRHAAGARVELFLAADSSFRWVTAADSLGRFTLRDLAPGTYQARAWVDTNNDRRLGLREVSDTATLTLTDRAAYEFYGFIRDTIAPRVEMIEPIDSTGLRVRFDRAIPADWDASGAVELFAPDSSQIALTGTLVPLTRFDSVRAAARSARDSSAADSLQGDSAAVTDSAAVPAPSPADTTDPQVVDVARDSVPMDPAPVFGRLKPETTWAVPLDAPLVPGTYRLRITGARGLNGAQAVIDREFRVRPPPPPTTPADSATTPAPPPIVPPSLRQ